MRSPVRVAVIGAGVMGARHARLYSQIPGYEFAGVFDPDTARATEVADQFGGIAFRDFNALLDDVEAATVASPTSTHAAVARRAMDAGLHLLIEKPMAASVDEARHIVERSDASDRVLLVGHVELFNPAVAELRRTLAGRKVRHVTLRRIAPFTSRCLDTNVVSDLMIHDINLVQNLFGSDIVSITADGEAVETTQIDRAVVDLTLATGTRVTLFASRVGASQTRQIDVTADGICVLADLLNRSISMTSVTPTGGRCLIEQYDAPPGEPLRLELQHFLNCIRGQEKPQIDAACGYRAVEWVDRIDRLIDQRRLTAPAGAHAGKVY